MPRQKSSPPLPPVKLLNPPRLQMEIPRKNRRKTKITRTTKIQQPEPISKEPPSKDEFKVPMKAPEFIKPPALPTCDNPAVVNCPVKSTNNQRPSPKNPKSQNCLIDHLHGLASVPTKRINSKFWKAEKLLAPINLQEKLLMFSVSWNRAICGWNIHQSRDITPFSSGMWPIQRGNCLTTGLGFKIFENLFHKNQEKWKYKKNEKIKPIIKGPLMGENQQNEAPTASVRSMLRRQCRWIWPLDAKVHYGWTRGWSTWRDQRVWLRTSREIQETTTQTGETDVGRVGLTKKTTKRMKRASAGDLPRTLGMTIMTLVKLIPTKSPSSSKLPWTRTPFTTATAQSDQSLFTSDAQEPPWALTQTPKGRWECKLELPIGDGAAGVVVSGEADGKIGAKTVCALEACLALDRR